MIGVMSAVNELLETVVGLLSLPKKPCRAHVHINASYRQYTLPIIRYQLSGIHHRKLFSVVTLLQFLPRDAMHPRY